MLPGIKMSYAEAGFHGGTGGRLPPLKSDWPASVPTQWLLTPRNGPSVYVMWRPPQI